MHLYSINTTTAIVMPIYTISEGFRTTSYLTYALATYLRIAILLKTFIPESVNYKPWLWSIMIAGPVSQEDEKSREEGRRFVACIEWIACDTVERRGKIREQEDFGEKT